MAPLFLLWGIVGGVFTPTEAGVAACAYALVISVFWYRTLTFQKFIKVIVRATLSSAMVMFIIGSATVMSLVITWDQSMAELALWFSGLTNNIVIQLTMINIFLLLLGCLIEGVPALLIMVPIFLPIIDRLGIDPIHFGVIMILNLLIGIITPPMGIGLFIMSNLSGLKVEQVTRACIPFLWPLLITLAFVTYFPSLTLYLPNWLLP
jgi:tripartite ATP-independent transporter DctM subunit